MPKGTSELSVFSEALGKQKAGVGQGPPCADFLPRRRLFMPRLTSHPARQTLTLGLSHLNHSLRFCMCLSYSHVRVLCLILLTYSIQLNYCIFWALVCLVSDNRNMIFKEFLFFNYSLHSVLLCIGLGIVVRKSYSLQRRQDKGD